MRPNDRDGAQHHHDGALHQERGPGGSDRFSDRALGLVERGICESHRSSPLVASTRKGQTSARQPVARLFLVGFIMPRMALSMAASTTLKRAANGKPSAVTIKTTTP